MVLINVIITTNYSNAFKNNHLHVVIAWLQELYFWLTYGICCKIVENR